MKDETTQERCPTCGSAKRNVCLVYFQPVNRQAKPFSCYDEWHMGSDSPAYAQRSVPGGERAAELRTTVHKSGCAIFGPMVNCEPAKCDCGAELWSTPEQQVSPVGAFTKDNDMSKMATSAENLLERGVSPSTGEQAIWDAVNHYAPKATESVASPQETRCNFAHSMPSIYQPCCLKTGHNPPDQHLFMPVEEVSKVYHCTPVSVASESGGAREQIYATDIARELYDRFAMGGWEPIEAHAWLRTQLAEYAAEVKQEAESRVAALREKLALRERQLRIFGNHPVICGWVVGNSCDCGLREALADLSPLAKPEVEKEK